MKHIIGKVGVYTIFTVPDDKVEPGHQWIGIDSSDIGAAYVLATLTGSEPHVGQETAIVEGVYCRMAEHNQVADERLCNLVDLCADLRFKAPDLIQIRLFDEKGESDAAR